ncbi:hypothetical protein L1987_84031 [Smallanthus sonchifolius]|uniref:Uncharacterized protein n=1 Tax=Smallanthus sonchifolius TaxID=185202 RepID=A0ACB8YHS7_9ASTR|nr:hypothetical protein L1987_84031 [Smallanthus sonchifolius]
MESSSSSSSSSIAIETNNAFKILSKLSNISFDSKSNSLNLDRLREENGGVLEDETLPLSGGESKGKKKVLILMSDTGGGHRASAEAIKRHLLRTLVMIMRCTEINKYPIKTNFCCVKHRLPPENFSLAGDFSLHRRMYDNMKIQTNNCIFI